MKRLNQSIKKLLDKYESLNLTAEEIADKIEDFGEYVWGSMLFKALDKSESFKVLINEAIEIVKERRKQKFKSAVKTGKLKEFFEGMDSYQIVSLQMDLGLCGLEGLPLTPEEERYIGILDAFENARFREEEKEYEEKKNKR